MMSHTLHSPLPSIQRPGDVLRRQLTHEEVGDGQVEEEVVALVPQGLIHNESHDDQRVPGHHDHVQGHHEDRRHHRQVARQHDAGPGGHRRGEVAAGVGLQQVRAHGYRRRGDRIVIVIFIFIISVDLFFISFPPITRKNVPLHLTHESNMTAGGGFCALGVALLLSCSAAAHQRDLKSAIRSWRGLDGRKWTGGHRQGRMYRLSSRQQSEEDGSAALRSKETSLWDERRKHFICSRVTVADV
ncbi:hypothetical protein EYF80_047668 [Liparis tanakae]|uniref:Uncharacterized protein n=1 Tax=Liparis tanakae TaxID=230148 RepID=A0A4Z2FN05_9TELE|nr:hypothetical protein EYF80_047668 [Liparis tanakae]